MATFKPTPEQQSILDEGARWFAESQNSGAPPYSRRFVEKCTSEMGIKPRLGRRKSIIASALTYIFGNRS
jgi:hypothetical protein